MGDVKRKQHYVWRHYLQPWTNNSNKCIWTYFKETKKVANPGLMGVGQEKYFYELVHFTEKEEEFLRRFIPHISHPTFSATCLDFLTLFTTHSKLQDQLNKATNVEAKKRKYIQTEITKLQKNMMEDAHCKFEQMGFKLTACRSLNDLKFLDNQDDLDDTLMFLCVQYFRTKNMKNLVVEALEDNKGELDYSKFWNILSFVLAVNLMRGIAVDTRLKFLFFENKTNLKFLTCDQPIFNILKDKVDEKGQVTDLELFYPLTPECAVSLCFQENQNDKYQHVLVNEGMVRFFNGKVTDNSTYFIFSSNKDQLDALSGANN